MPVFQTFGKTITLMGAAGAGQHTKMCNQIAIASGMIGVCEALAYAAGAGQHTKMCNQIAIAAGMLGVCEALAYAKGAGLDQTEMINTISTGAAASWSLSNYGPRIIKGDFAPGFYVKHFIKDMEIALQAAHEMGLEVPGLELALSRYRELAASGGSELGTQALYKLYADS
ncbi:MAG TPA: NAD-binding protein, partial [Longimicrobiales bacterium]